VFFIISENFYKKAVYFFVFVIFFLFVSYIALRYLFNLLLPFILGWFIAYIIQVPVKSAKKKYKFPKKFTALVLIFLIVFLISSLIFVLFSYLVYQLKDLYSLFLSESDRIFENVSEYLNDVKNFFGSSKLFSTLFDDFDPSLVVGELSEMLLSFLPALAAWVFSFVPGFFIFFLITVISAYYFTFDFHFHNKKIKALAGKGGETLAEFKEEFVSVAVGYLKASGIIFLLTFSQLFLGLSLLGIENSFAISVIISFIDILPVLGSGTVLIPWIIICVILNDWFLVGGLLLLYIFIVVLREILEPKLVSKFIGLHPLLSLFSMFFGLRIMGVWGIFVFPVLTIVFLNLYKKRKAKLTL